MHLSIRPFRLAFATGLASLWLASAVFAQTAAKPKPPDANSVRPTMAAAQAKPTDSDRALTQKIHRELTSDKTLSKSAHNVTVSTVNGQVTLRGTVPSEQVKSIVEQKAVAAAGTGHVTDELQVVAKK
jgi:osmotically-inducible protein OsmY